jgi:hypothetical protein
MESIWTLLRCIRVRGVCTDSTRTPHSLHRVHKDIWGSVKYCSPPTISGGGGGQALRPSIGAGGACISLMTWKMGWRQDMDRGSLRQYACEPTGRMIGKGPR